jgi:DNA polymerase-1
MYLAGQDNFRKTLYPAYKANRADKEPPMWLEDCREYLVCEWRAKIVNDMEVDDMCGIRMSCLQAEDVDAICVSLDKDLLQIPGKHYNFVNQEFTSTTALQGLRIFYKQIILGDASDNVPGYDGKFRSACPKFIEAMQRPLDEMADEADMYEHVCNIYQTTTEDWEKTVLLHGQLLYCLRAEGEMWQPPKRKQL